MADTVERDDSRKTVVAFITGLLIGGLLVWVFSSTPANENKTVPTAPEAPSAPSTTGSKDTSSNGNGSSTDTTSNGSASGDVVSDQGAGNSVELGSIDFPT
ncbi:MAG TPA: hypothetical protein VFS75_01090, partial [Candidatus Paceibacterota bacterium]|nr:hypothetical protein [Candidatus Paceibacterota bacterium]